MKVLHINKGQVGGASWCARRINNALVKQGIDSKMLFAEGDIMPEGINGAIANKDNSIWYTNWFTTKVKHLINRLPFYMDADKMTSVFESLNSKLPPSKYLHHPFSDYKNIAYHPLVKEVDIIHLHWVPEFIDYPTFFKHVKKPIVWTLHDMFPAVGAMHFESAYSVLPKELENIDAQCRKIKKGGLDKSQKLYVVAISDMMKQIIKSSDVLKDFPVTLIHNGVDTRVFKPTDIIPSELKEFISLLDKSTKIFMFSSFSIGDVRKGIDRVLIALENFKVEHNVNIALVAVGATDKKDILPKVSFPVCFTGRITDQEKLAMIYSNADFFINASYEEAFAQTPLEAMACGTPVISTPCSGASDLIKSFNGIICNGFDSNDLAEAIVKVLNRNYNSELIRKYIVDEYDYEKIAKQYIKLYEKVLIE